MYHKVRFTNGDECTAGLIVTAAQARLPITELSRFFPRSEFRKMARVQISPAYKTWDEAFAHKFA